MLLETVLRPRAPYSLLDSVGATAGGTRRLRSGVLELLDRVGDDVARVRVAQRADGSLVARVEGLDPEVAEARLRFLLAVDDDHAPFLRMARADPLLAEVAWRWEGMRPLRLPTPAHAVLAAVCGQLVTGREAARMQRAILDLLAPRRDGLRVPPAQEDLARLAPAQCCAIGLAARRAAALVRVCRGPALERLHTRTTAQAVTAICRERDLGPWSAAVVTLYGLGRYEHGLVGDLGLMRLLAAQTGAWPCEADTAGLLSRYGEWAGLASVYLLRHPLAMRAMPAGALCRRSPRTVAAGRGR